MNGRDFPTRIANLVKIWAAGGIIDSDTASAIMSSYPMEPDNRRSRAGPILFLFRISQLNRNFMNLRLYLWLCSQLSAVCSGCLRKDSGKCGLKNATGDRGKVNMTSLVTSGLIPARVIYLGACVQPKYDLLVEIP